MISSGMKNLFLIFFALCCNVIVAQDINDSLKNNIGASLGMQLSTTKFAAIVTIDYYQNKNLFYVGPKIPISNNSIYGYFPVGIAFGYGRQLIGNKSLKVYFIPDIQWLGSKTQNQGKATHYIDMTLNYQLSYSKIKNFRFSSSFGYGIFIKYYYRNDLQEWGNSTGISGLVRFSVSYLLK